MLLFFSISFNSASDFLELFVLVLVLASVIVASATGMAAVYKNVGQRINKATADPNACPWYLTWYSWGKRHTPVVGLVISLLGLLFVYRWLPTITYWANNAHIPYPGQKLLDGDQVLAEQQAGGSKQLGAIFTTFLGGTFYFSSLLFGVWSLMGYIFPAVPAWAKRNFSAGFRDYRDADFDPLLALPNTWKYGVKLTIFFGLLLIWAGSLYVAANVQ